MFKGLGNLANLGSIVKQAQLMGSKLQGLNEELRARRTTGAAGGGMVEVDVNGLGEVLACRLDPSLFASGDRELTEGLLPAAINQAQSKAKELHSQAVKSMTEGLDMAGFGEMLAEMSKAEPGAAGGGKN